MSEAARMASLADGETQQQANAAADAGFLWNFWYPALRSEEIRGTKLATAMLLEVPLVLGRTSDGRTFAMRDACPHRGIPLSYGRFDGKVVDGVVNGSAWSTVEGALGSSWWDRWIVDGIVKFIGGFIKTLSWPLRLIETGYTQNYALVMILGVLIFIGYVLWGTP